MKEELVKLVYEINEQIEKIISNTDPSELEIDALLDSTREFYRELLSTYKPSPELKSVSEAPKTIYLSETQINKLKEIIVTELKETIADEMAAQKAIASVKEEIVIPSVKEEVIEEPIIETPEASIDNHPVKEELIDEEHPVKEEPSMVNHPAKENIITEEYPAKEESINEEHPAKENPIIEEEAIVSEIPVENEIIDEDDAEEKVEELIEQINETEPEPEVKEKTLGDVMAEAAAKPAAKPVVADLFSEFFFQQDTVADKPKEEASKEPKTILEKIQDERIKAETEKEVFKVAEKEVEKPTQGMSFIPRIPVEGIKEAKPQPTPEKEIEKPVEKLVEESLNEKLSKATEAATIATTIATPKVNDLKSSIGINERFLFINELFEGNFQEYNDTVEAINKIVSLDDAIRLIEDLKAKHHWEDREDAANDFMSLIGRKYAI